MRDRIVPALAVVLIVALSAELILSKREAARLRSELQGATRAFVQGLELPSLPVQAASGPARLGDYCREGRPAVFFFSTLTCRFCERLRPRWEAMAAARGSEVTFVEVHLDGIPAGGRQDGPLDVAALPPDVSEHLRVASVPAIVVANSSCHIHVAGVGLTAARFALEAVAPAG